MQLVEEEWTGCFFKVKESVTHSLPNTLKIIVDDAGLPGLVRDADVVFENPGYKPSKAMINGFLCNVRENTELHDSESGIDRRIGMWS